jgi:hypothetical protein
MAAWDLVQLLLRQPQRPTPLVLRLFLTKLKIVNQTGHVTAVVAVRTQKVTADL